MEAPPFKILAKIYTVNEAVECPLKDERVQTCKSQLALERQVGAVQATAALLSQKQSHDAQSKP
jgi:hypothetical protein